MASESSLKLAREFCEEYADDAMMGGLYEDWKSTLPEDHQRPIDILADLLDRELQAQHDELNRWQMTAEEGVELLNEMTFAIAGLAREPLVSCCGTCIGHFGPKGGALMDKGLKQWALVAAANKPTGDTK